MITTETFWPTLVGDIPNRRLANCVLEAAALRHGLDTVRINGSTFVAGEAPWFNTLGFWGPLSSETSRNATRITRDRVKRKAALAASGIRTPQSRRFGYSHTEEAIAYAQRFRRGVIIKPRALDAGRISLKALTDPEEIRRTISAWQKTPGAGRDFLVEGRISGPEYVFYVVGSQVHSVVRRRRRIWDEEVYRVGGDQNQEIHPEVLDLAVNALAAIPRTPFGEVRIAGRNALTDPARCRVVSVRATIELVSGPSPRGWTLSLADLLLSHRIQQAPGVEDVAPRTRVHARVSATELAGPEESLNKISAWLAQGPIEGDLHAGDSWIKGALTGTPGELASFSYVMRTGRLTSEVPQTVTLTQSAHIDGSNGGYAL